MTTTLPKAGLPPQPSNQKEGLPPASLKGLGSAVQAEKRLSAISIQEVLDEAHHLPENKHTRMLVDEIEKADHDHSGAIDAVELVSVVNNIVTAKEKNTHIKHLLWLACGIIFMQTALNAATVIATTSAYKDQYVQGSSSTNGAANRRPACRVRRLFAKS